MNELLIEIIKTDLKNNIESGMLNEQDKLIAINESLRLLSTMNNPEINEVIKKYRQKQNEQEEKLLKAQTQIIENAKNIYNHLMKEI